MSTNPGLITGRIHYAMAGEGADALRLSLVYVQTSPERNVQRGVGRPRGGAARRSMQIYNGNGRAAPFVTTETDEDGYFSLTFFFDAMDIAGVFAIDRPRYKLQIELPMMRGGEVAGYVGRPHWGRLRRTVSLGAIARSAPQVHGNDARVREAAEAAQSVYTDLYGGRMPHTGIGTPSPEVYALVDVVDLWFNPVAA